MASKGTTKGMNISTFTAMPRKSRILSGLLLANLMTVSAAVVVNAPAIAQEASQFADAVANLAGQIRAEIARLPKDGAVENYEAAILFLADQSGQPVNVVCAAFDEVKQDATAPDNAKQAMNTVCRTLKVRRGTGAIGNSGSAFVSPSFSAPSINVGGGSGYSQPQ